MKELLDLLKQAQAQALDPQDYEPGAAVKTLDEAILELQKYQYAMQIEVENAFVSLRQKLDKVCANI